MITRYMPASAARIAITFRIARVSAEKPEELRRSKSANRRNVTAKRYPWSFSGRTLRIVLRHR